MLEEVTSRHLRSATELILLCPIKPGFVPVSELHSYASRLNTVLEALYGLRQLAIERSESALAGPVERLRTIHRVQWTVLEGPQQLLVTAHYDQSWEAYFKVLVDITGPLLDLVFSHCVGFEGLTSADGYDRFAQFIRRHQKPCDFLFVGNPELSVDDVKHLSELSTAGPTDPKAMAERTAKSPLETFRAVRNTQTIEDRVAHERNLARAMVALHDVRKSRFSSRTELGPGWTHGEARSGHRLFDDAFKALLAHELDQARPELPAEVDAWVATLLDSPKADSAWYERPIQPLRSDDLSDVQGNILEGYTGMTHGCVALVRCDGPSSMARFFRNVRALLTSQAQAGSLPASTARVNLGLTYAGLAQAGLGDDVLSGLPKEFREGMEERAGLIGDLGVAHPDNWHRPIPNRQGEVKEGAGPIDLDTVDAVVVVQVCHQEGTGWQPDTVLDKLGPGSDGIHILHVQPLQRVPSTDGNAREHFGFREDRQASSQPVPDLRLADLGVDFTCGRAARDRVAVGELLLGYKDARGQVAACADPESNENSALFRNGTFMAMRKLRQHVGAFRSYAQSVVPESASEKKRQAELVQEQFLGRTFEGAPVGQPVPAVPNDFDYEPRDGVRPRCPLHAHIRLANPRHPATNDVEEGLRAPRIMRRGFAYGAAYDPVDAADEIDRGLVFMAYNASLSGQYEVIQRWLNGGNSTGILTAQNDPLASTLPHTPVPTWVDVGDTLQQVPVRTQPFVSLQWGMYLFVPSCSAVDWIVEQADHVEAAQAKRHAASVERGNKIIERLDALPVATGAQREHAKWEWKRVIEESSLFEDTSAVWAAIHASGGTKRTPYAALVASAQGARQILGDEGGGFSVREYWHRLRRTSGEHYLAFDPAPGTLREPGAQSEGDEAYERRMHAVSYSMSGLPNEFLQGLTQDEAFDDAHRHASAFLSSPGDLELTRGQPRITVRVHDLAQFAVGQLAATWLGLPGADNPARLVQSLERLVLASRYAFQPFPEPVVGDEAEDRCRDLRSEYAQPTGAMAATLQAQNLPRDQIVDAMIGATVGFAAPAISCIRSVLDLWDQDSALARMIPLAKPEHAKQALLVPLITALARRPVPSILYRTATSDGSVGSLTVRAGERVLVSLGAVTADARLEDPSDADFWRWLFGGAHGGAGRKDGAPPHGCPARHAAVGAMAGVIAALLQQPGLKQEYRGVVSYVRAMQC